jgi:hypothetical protein
VLNIRFCSPFSSFSFGIASTSSFIALHSVVLTSIGSD